MTQQNSPEKILIIGPSWVGDMVMTQTLFKSLAQDNVIIDVLAPNWSRPLLERMPQVRKAIVMPLGHGEFNLKKRYEIGKYLRAEKYDRAIVVPNSFKSALIPFFAKIPKRIGWLRELRGMILTDGRKLDKQHYPLMIERLIALAYPKNTALQQPYPRPSFSVNQQQINEALAKYQLTADKPITVMCPGAEFGPAKRWPEQHYAFVANELLDKGGQVWLMGSVNDQAVTSEINRLTENRCHDLAGATSLGEAIDLMSLAKQVVTNDSGLMHIAAALNRPLVAVYGSSSPEFTPPLADKVAIVREGLPCSPCFKRICPLGHLNCLKQLSPNKVINALHQLDM